MNYKDTPPYNEYSSLNSILMSALYSENSRDLIIKKAKTWDNSNKFKTIIKRIVNKNKQKKDITFEISSLLPDDIFIKSMYFLKDVENQRKFAESIRTSSNKIDWIDDFIIDFYRSLGLSCLDIFYMENKNIYLNLYKFILWTYNKDGYKTELNKSIFKNLKTELREDKKPDVLILFHKDLNNSIDKYNLPSLTGDKKIRANLEILLNDLKRTDEKYDIFKDVKEEIEFDGVSYILDSILLKNEDKSIVGFRCDGEKYIYKNFESSFDNPCSIIKFDWKYDEGEFSYNPFKCDLEDGLTDIDNLCFNFKTYDKTLIYIKKDIKPTVPEIPDSEILGIIKKIKEMDQLLLIQKIKEYEPNIINNSMTKEELEKIYLRLFLINYMKEKEVPPVAETPA